MNYTIPPLPLRSPVPLPSCQQNPRHRRTVTLSFSAYCAQKGSIALSDHDFCKLNLEGEKSHEQENHHA